MSAAEETSRPPLRRERREDAVWLTLDRPERGNALDAELVGALTAALADCAEDGATRAVCLTGAGERAFCAGGDLSEIAAGGEALGAYAELLRAMARFPKPLVARLNGHAMGGGLGIALLCDQVIAAEGATLSTPELGVGLFPWMILPVLAAQLPPKVLGSLVLGREALDARRAADLGLVAKITPAAELDAACTDALARLAALPPTVRAEGIVHLRRTQFTGLDAHLAGAAERLAWNMDQEEFRAGVAAFLAKRPAPWARASPKD
ncbi:MAG: enoyl-CoA hydratase-related protein [Planctomycetota bacterium]|nr:enoyl-CoA hydratase-related protein [Planctomycetota bacterium]MDP6764114.1 enoyl-CoA hydratase-related protein [Planctomycetota bacterium]MDP6989597.1 enoyl-CoA hydratase-related protein [Planctomycetota bacterium]